jgi:cell division protein ZapA
MADVRLMIASREYIVTCQDGEEARLIELGETVDAKAREAGGAAGGLNESRQLLFAALLLADQIKEGGNGLGGKTAAAPTGLPDDAANQIAATLENLAERIENLAAGLEQKPTAS